MPEEINQDDRSSSSVLFCSSDTGKSSLQKEGIQNEVHVGRHYGWFIVFGKIGWEVFIKWHFTLPQLQKLFIAHYSQTFQYRW